MSSHRLTTSGYKIDEDKMLHETLGSSNDLAIIFGPGASLYFGTIYNGRHRSELSSRQLELYTNLGVSKNLKRDKAFLFY